MCAAMMKPSTTTQFDVSNREKEIRSDIRKIEET